MIDFHSHIIPTIDDGAREIKETMKMLEEAYSAGFDGIISTSHYMEGYYEVNQADRKVWINGIQYALEKKKIGLSLYLGSEIYFSEKILEFIKEGKASTINGSKYILFEFPLNAKPMNIEDVIYTNTFRRLYSCSSTSGKICIYAKKSRINLRASKPRCAYAIKLWKHNWTIWKKSTSNSRENA